MFHTDDNAGDIRINYASDLDLVQKINRVAGSQNNPLVYHRAMMGGYRFPILEGIAADRMFQILKTTIPNNNPLHVNALVKVLRDVNTVYSYVDGTSITVVQIEDWDNRSDDLDQHGWEAVSGQKTFKRLKTLNRPFRLWAKPGRRLRVAIVDDTDYSDSENVADLDSETRERLLDGAFVISRGLYDECLQNLSMPVVEGEIETTDGLRSAEMREQFSRVKTFNARIFGDFEYIGIGGDDPLHDVPGQLKGQAFIRVDDTCERMHVDIIAARSALKKEVISRNESVVLLDPQTTKFRVNGDLQSITNNPALFDPGFISKWVRVLILGEFENLKHNRLMESWFQMANPEYLSNNELKYNQDDLTKLTMWNARCWVMSGMDLDTSPWLFEQMSRNLISLINSNDITRMRIPVPCAVRCQVISQSLCSMMGVDDIEVEQGAIRWVPSHHVLVVHDDDWLEMYESHGGQDLDDFFVGYWRSINSQHKVVIMRSPNDFGEYSIFDYVPGDWYPVEELYNGRSILFPEISDEPEMWPQRLSEAVREGVIHYRGFTSAKSEKATAEKQKYSVLDTVAAIDNNVNAQSCVGANVNARSLWSLTMREHRVEQLAPMEACIDTGAQGGNALDIEEVTEEAKEILGLILESGKKVDRYLWETRFAPLGMEIASDRLSDLEHVSQIHEFKKAFIRAFMNMSRDYISKQVGKTTNPLIHTLGVRYLQMGAELLRASRRQVAIARMEGGGETSITAWSDIHDYIQSRIEELPTIEDQHDLILSIHSASLKLPTFTTGRISDQLVMNPRFFDKLMAALRYYGIAGHLKVDEFGRIVRYYTKSWEIMCKGCNRTATVKDPLRVQAHHRRGMRCSPCMEKDEAKA